MDFKRIVKQAFWQGLLKWYVLHQVAKGPTYGVKIKKQLQALGYNISPGSLYPLLHDFEKFGLCTSKVKIFKGRVRKYYSITDNGLRLLNEIGQEVEKVLQELVPGSLAPIKQEREPAP